MAKVFSIENVKPEIMRKAIREGQVKEETVGMCRNYLQANVVIIPKSFANSFVENERISNNGCRILEVLESGNHQVKKVANDTDIRKSVSKYRVIKDGIVVEERSEINNLWQEDFVTILIDCKCNLGKEIFKEKLINNRIEADYVNMPNIMITNAPGHMLITDLVVETLN